MPPLPVDPVLPTDTLTTAVKTAFTLETDVNRLNQAKSLAAVYASLITDKSVTVGTLDDCYRAAHRAGNMAVGLTALTKVRQAIATEFNSKLPTGSDIVITDLIRADLLKQFKRAQTALESLK